VLVEGGFLTNKNEIGKLANASYREQLAVAISDGILKYREGVKASADDLDGASP
jgi:N-acetylmuramoyl-L-alanine amidase